MASVALVVSGFCGFWLCGVWLLSLLWLLASVWVLTFVSMPDYIYIEISTGFPMKSLFFTINDFYVELFF